MEDNPFISILKSCGADVGIKNPNIILGNVVNVSPLAIKAKGLILSGDDLLCNKELLARHLLFKNVGGSFSGNLGEASGSGNLSGELEGDLPSGLSIGDMVLMISDDGDKYVVVCACR